MVHVPPRPIDSTCPCPCERVMKRSHYFCLKLKTKQAKYTAGYWAYGKNFGSSAMSLCIYTRGWVYVCICIYTESERERLFITLTNLTGAKRLFKKIKGLCARFPSSFNTYIWSMYAVARASRFESTQDHNWAVVGELHLFEGK